MTTQQKGDMKKQPTAADIRRENQEAYEAEQGYVDPEGQDHNTASSDPDSPERKQQVADIVRRQQQEQAESQEEFMRGVAERRRQLMHQNVEEDDLIVEGDDETLDNPDDVDDNQDQDEEASGAQGAQQQTEQQQAQEEKPGFFIGEDGNEYARLRVNGVMKVVPAQQALTALQKLEAGDERLRQAAERQRQLDLREQEINSRSQAQQSNHQPSTTDAANDDIRARLRNGFDKLYNEGDESSIDELVDLLAERHSATPKIDPNEVAQQTITVLNQRNWDATVQSDIQAYESSEEFADIVGNEYLNSQAVERVRQLAPMARDRGIRPLDLIREVTNQIRAEGEQLAQAFGYHKAAPDPDPTPSRQQQVAARKQKLGNTVVSGGEHRTMSTPEQQQRNAPAGGLNPNSREAKLKAFSGLTEFRDKPAFKR